MYLTGYAYYIMLLCTDSVYYYRNSLIKMTPILYLVNTEGKLTRSSQLDIAKPNHNFDN